jgi:hypothetical protein
MGEPAGLSCEGQVEAMEHGNDRFFRIETFGDETDRGQDTITEEEDIVARQKPEDTEKRPREEDREKGFPPAVGDESQLASIPEKTGEVGVLLLDAANRRRKGT